MTTDNTTDGTVAATDLAGTDTTTTEVVETGNVDDPTAIKAEGETDTPPAEEGDKEPEEKKGFQRRLERAKTKAKQEAAAEIEYWKKQAMQAGTPAAAPAPSAPAEGKPNRADYDDVDDYIAAQSQYLVQAELNKHRTQQQQQSVQDTYVERANAYKKTNPTFEADVQDFIDLYADTPMQELTQLAYESEVGPALVHYLSKHDDEMEKILAMPSHRRLIALGKLEDKLGASTTAATASPAKKSAAPAPVTPEKGSPSAKKSLDDPNLSQAEYRALRAAQLAAKGIR